MRRPHSAATETSEDDLFCRGRSQCGQSRSGVDARAAQCRCRSSLYRTWRPANERGRRRDLPRLDREIRRAWIVGSDQALRLLAKTISRNAARDRLEQADRRRVDRLPRIQSAACSHVAKTIAIAKNYLLHQPASLGLEPWPHQKDGALARSHALYLSVRSRSL